MNNTEYKHAVSMIVDRLRSKGFAVSFDRESTDATFDEALLWKQRVDRKADAKSLGAYVRTGIQNRIIVLELSSRKLSRETYEEYRQFLYNNIGEPSERCCGFGYHWLFVVDKDFSAADHCDWIDPQTGEHEVPLISRYGEHGCLELLGRDNIATIAPTVIRTEISESYYEKVGDPFKLSEHAEVLFKLIPETWPQTSNIPPDFWTFLDDEQGLISDGFHHWTTHYLVKNMIWHGANRQEILDAYQNEIKPAYQTPCDDHEQLIHQDTTDKHDVKYNRRQGWFKTITSRGIYLQDDTYHRFIDIDRFTGEEIIYHDGTEIRNPTLISKTDGRLRKEDPNRPLTKEQKKGMHIQEIETAVAHAVESFRVLYCPNIETIYAVKDDKYSQVYMSSNTGAFCPMGEQVIVMCDQYYNFQDEANLKKIVKRHVERIVFHKDTIDCRDIYRQVYYDKTHHTVYFRMTADKALQITSDQIQLTDHPDGVLLTGYDVQMTVEDIDMVEIFQEFSAYWHLSKYDTVRLLAVMTNWCCPVDKVPTLILDGQSNSRKSSLAGAIRSIFGYDEDPKVQRKIGSCYLPPTPMQSNKDVIMREFQDVDLRSIHIFDNYMRSVHGHLKSQIIEKYITSFANGTPLDSYVEKYQTSKTHLLRPFGMIVTTTGIKLSEEIENRVISIKLKPVKLRKKEVEKTTYRSLLMDHNSRFQNRILNFIFKTVQLFLASPREVSSERLHNHTSLMHIIEDNTGIRNDLYDAEVKRESDERLLEMIFEQPFSYALWHYMADQGIRYLDRVNTGHLVEDMVQYLKGTRHAHIIKQLPRTRMEITNAFAACRSLLYRVGITTTRIRAQRIRSWNIDASESELFLSSMRKGETDGQDSVQVQ